MSELKNINRGTGKRSWWKKISTRKTLAVVFGVGVLLCGVGTGISLVEYSAFEYLGEKNIGGNDTETKTITEKLYRGQSGDGKVYVHPVNYGEDAKMTVETTGDIPQDQIQFVVEYNPNNVKNVQIDWEEITGNGAYYYGYYDSYYDEVDGEYEEEAMSEYEEEATEYSEESTEVEMSEEALAASQTESRPEESQEENRSYITYMVNPVLMVGNELDGFLTYKDEILQNLKEKRFYNYNFPTVSAVTVRINPANAQVVDLY